MSNGEIAGQKKQDTEYCWLAGFIDGEGSLGLNKEKDPRKGENYFVYRPALQIVNTNKEVMEWIYNFIGEGDFRILLRKEENHQLNYRFMLRKQSSLLLLLRRILPFLKLKNLHAQMLIEYIKNRQSSPKKGWYNPYNIIQINKIFNKLKTLNLRGRAALCKTT